MYVFCNHISRPEGNRIYLLLNFNMTRYLGPHSPWTLCLLRLIMMKVDIKVKGNASVEKTITSLIMNRCTLFP